MFPLPFLILNFLSSLSFFGYGLSCLGTEGMKKEFDRFGLSNFRVLIGITQLLGAAALAVGPWFVVWGLIASAGLSLQMLAGVGVRIRIHDSLAQTIQAIGFLLINLFLCVSYIQNL